MLILPVCQYLEKKEWSRGMAVLCCIVILITVAGLLIFVLTWQIADLTQDVSNIQAQMKKFLAGVQKYINDHFGITPQVQNKIIEQQQSATTSTGSMGINVVAFIGGFLADLVLTLV